MTAKTRQIKNKIKGLDFITLPFKTRYQLHYLTSLCRKAVI